MKSVVKRRLVVTAIALVATAVVAYLATPSGTPHVPFDGLRERAVLYDKGAQCPNGDYTDVRAYQLYPFNVQQWIRNNSPHWVRGPLRDPRYSKALVSNGNDENNSPGWPYEQWLRSAQFYFYLEDYEEFSGDGMDGIVHHSTIWALDGKSYKLFLVAGSM